MTITTDQKLSQLGTDILREEYLRLCADIRSVESTNERILTLGAGLVTAAFAYGFANPAYNQLFVVIPIAATILMIYGCLVYFWVYSMGGYKLHIEELLNREIGATILIWETLAPERAKSNVGRFVLPALYGLIWAVLVVFSALKVEQAYPENILIILSVGFGLLLAAFAIVARSALTIGTTTYNRAKQLYATGKDL
jgi:hypothetical protein